MYIHFQVQAYFLGHTHTFHLTENIRVLYTHTHTCVYTFCIIIAIIKLFFFKVLVFCHISRVYVACTNLCCIIVELTPEVLFFVEPQEILFLDKF